MTELVVSHVLCRVTDLVTAVADYTEAGFSVEWGSAPETAHNALIRFDSGPFLELLQLPEPTEPDEGAVRSGIEPRAAHWARFGEGLLDLAVEAPDVDLDGTVSRLRHNGFECTRPARYHRLRPDGLLLGWWLSAPYDRSLPFLMSAYDPPQPPPVNGGRHPNGVVRISRILIGSPDVDRTRARWEALFGGIDPLLGFVADDRHTIVAVDLAHDHPRSLDPELLHGAVLRRGGRASHANTPGLTSDRAPAAGSAGRTTH